MCVCVLVGCGGFIYGTMCMVDHCDQMEYASLLNVILDTNFSSPPSLDEFTEDALVDSRLLIAHWLLGFLLHQVFDR